MARCHGRVNVKVPELGILSRWRDKLLVVVAGNADQQNTDKLGAHLDILILYSVFCWSALPATTARSLSLQRLSMPSSGTFSFTLPRHRAIHNYVQTISYLTASCYTCFHHVKNIPRIIALYVATIYNINSGESNLQPLDYEPDVVSTRLFTHW